MRCFRVAICRGSDYRQTQCASQQESSPVPALYLRVYRASRNVIHDTFFLSKGLLEFVCASAQHPWRSHDLVSSPGPICLLEYCIGCKELGQILESDREEPASQFSSDLLIGYTGWARILPELYLLFSWLQLASVNHSLLQMARLLSLSWLQQPVS